MGSMRRGDLLSFAVLSLPCGKANKREFCVAAHLSDVLQSILLKLRSKSKSVCHFSRVPVSCIICTMWLPSAPTKLTTIKQCFTLLFLRSGFSAAVRKWHER